MIDVNDVLALGGLGMAAVGAWLLAPAAALTLIGLTLFAVGVIRQRPGRR